MKAIGILAAVTVLSVLDGDTVKVRIDDCRPAFLCEVSVRVNGIDTPESHMPPAKCVEEKRMGQAAALYARGLLSPGESVTARFDHPDKFGGRWDGDIALPDGRWLGETMIAHGLARPYGGKAKGSWCP
jgi:micrococcal nuclease